MQHTGNEVPTGGAKPVAKPTPESLKACTAEPRVDLAGAPSRLREVMKGARPEALVKIGNLMRAVELLPADRNLTPKHKHRGRPREAAS